MLKGTQQEYLEGLENYMEQQKLYELFEGMMKGLIMNKPKNPIDYLINKL